MSDALDVKPALPLLLAPIALVEGWKRRVPRSHLDLAGDAPRDVVAAQLGAHDTLLFARRGPVVLVPHDDGLVIVLGLAGGAAARDKAAAAIAKVKTWEEAGITFESVGGAYAIFQKPDKTLALDLPAGKYDGWTARTKIGEKTVLLVRIARTGPRTPTKHDLETPPELSDADFAAAEALVWTTLPEQVAAVVDDLGGLTPPAKAPTKPVRAGDAIVAPSGYSMLAWPIAGGVLLAGSNLGDAPDNVAALLAIPEARFADTGLTLEVKSGKVRLFDPEGDEEPTKLKLAKGTYRVATVPRFTTAAVELVSVLRLTRV